MAKSKIDDIKQILIMKTIKIKINKDKIKKYNLKFKKATLMDDMKFRKVCESKEAIEEILRVVLRDNKLKVIESIKQKSEEEPVFHGVILDCRCKLKTGEIVNIEVQVALDDNPLYRMRYNEAMLTIENSPKSKIFKYKNIPKVILIMFCDFDVFKKNKPIYEIERIEKNTKIIADNGVKEIYLNLKAKVTDKKLKSLFKIMTTISDTDEKAFPILSKRKLEINDMYIGGDMNMSGLTKEIYMDGLKEGKQVGKEAGREEGRKEGKLAFAINMFKKKLIELKDAAAELGMSEKEFLKLANA